MALKAVSAGARSILLGYERLLGTRFSAVDAGRAEDYMIAFQPRLDAAAIVARMEAHVAHCRAKDLPVPRTLAGFQPALQREFDHQADVVARRGTTSSRRSS